MIEIRNLTRRRWPSAFILRQAQKVVRRLGISQKNFEIILTSEEYMRRLNRKWRRKDASTTILSFATPPGFVLKEKFLGEIFICPAKIQKDAKAFGEPFRKELTRILIHGILHLAGFSQGKLNKHFSRERRERRLLAEFFNGRKDNLRN